MIKLNDAALFSWMTKEKWCWRVEPIPPCGCFQSLTFVSYTRHNLRPLCLYSLYLRLNVNNNSSKALSLSLPAGRCWWCFLSWREMPASPSPTAWLTARQPRPPWETGPPPKPHTAPSSPRTLTACTGPGLYDHRPLYPRLTCSSPINCQTTGKQG